MNMKHFSAIIFAFLSISFFHCPSSLADESSRLSDGQTIYVPAYSHIYSGNSERPFLLTVTLSIRNIDPKNQIKIVTADYYETQGKLLKKHLKNPIILKFAGIITLCYT